MAQIRQAEAKANKDSPAPDPNRKVVPWWEGPHASGKVAGTLQRVDCISGQARLVIQGQSGKPTQLMVRQPSQVAILGGGEKTLACGPQRPPRKVVVEFYPKPDPKTGTAGDAAVIEFQ